MGKTTVPIASSREERSGAQNGIKRNPYEWILASGSPRRKELLERIGVRFRVRVAHTEELSSETEPGRVVMDLALQKARAVHALEPQASIIAADTVVVLGGEILGKPVDRADNAAMLERLSGRTHTVYTGVALVTPEGAEARFEATGVRFRSLSSAEIEWYTASGEGLDKAGGYGIQELGMLLVEGIDGDFFNVMGLPMVCLYTLARALNLELVGGL